MLLDFHRPPASNWSSVSLRLAGRFGLSSYPVYLFHGPAIILVGTLDIPSLKALKLATSTLEVLNFPKTSWRFVLNRADGKVGLTTEEYEKTLGLKADSSLVSSREVLAAVNRGEALVTAYPNHPNSKALVSFATSVATSIAGP